MDLRGIRNSSQDDAEDEYNLDGREILKFGKGLNKLSFVRAKTSNARMQLTL